MKCHKLGYRRTEEIPSELWKPLARLEKTRGRVSSIFARLSTSHPVSVRKAARAPMQMIEW
jgi:hypothetical protein